MTNKEKIKQEIERLKNHTLNIQKSRNGLITSVGRGRVEAFNDILKFIDSLQEEHNEDLEEEFNRFLDEEEGVPRMWHSDEQMEWGMDTARHFAEWQKQQDKELFSKDSKKACVFLSDYIYDIHDESEN